MRNVFLRRTRDVGTPTSARRSTPSTPRWVKVSIIVFVIVVLVVLIINLAGHSPNHMQMLLPTHLSVSRVGGPWL